MVVDAEDSNWSLVNRCLLLCFLGQSVSPDGDHVGVEKG